MTVNLRVRGALSPPVTAAVSGLAAASGHVRRFHALQDSVAGTLMSPQLLSNAALARPSSATLWVSFQSGTRISAVI